LELKNKFLDLGTRNKGTFFEYGSAYSFKNAKVPGSDYDIPVFFGLGKGKANKHCHHLDVIEATKKLILREFEEGRYDEKFFEKVVKSYVDKFDKLQETCKSDFSTDSDEALAEKFESATDYIMESHKPMLIALKSMYLDGFYTDMLKNILSPEERKNSAQLNTIKSMLLTSLKPSIAQEEEQALWEIEKEFSDKDVERNRGSFGDFCEEAEVKKKLDKLVEVFGWFHMEYMYSPCTIEEYKEQLWKRIEGEAFVGKSPVGALRDIGLQQKEFFESHKNSEKLQEWTRVLHSFAYILDHTKVITIKGRYVAQPLFEEAAKRIGVSYDNLLYLVLPEITDALRTGKDECGELMKLIGNRKQNRAILLEGGEIKVYEGDEAIQIGEEMLHKEEVSGSDVVSGVIAFPGKVKGKVTVVSSIEDRDKFSKGDILVTHDGPAELTVFLKEAGAIVTNQGGMISHVSIVAREIKTPCIVGTKNATEILKDGDIVEVDADNGIVKILERAK